MNKFAVSSHPMLKFWTPNSQSSSYCRFECIYVHTAASPYRYNVVYTQHIYPEWDLQCHIHHHHSPSSLSAMASLSFSMKYRSCPGRQLHLITKDIRRCIYFFLSFFFVLFSFSLTYFLCLSFFSYFFSSLSTPSKSRLLPCPEAI